MIFCQRCQLSTIAYLKFQHQVVLLISLWRFLHTETTIFGVLSAWTTTNLTWRLNIRFPISGFLQVDQYQCSFSYFELWFIYRSHSIYPFGESINLFFYQWSWLSDMLLSRIHNKYFEFLFMLKSALSVNKCTRRLWTIDN